MVAELELGHRAEPEQVEEAPRPRRRAPTARGSAAARSAVVGALNARPPSPGSTVVSAVHSRATTPPNVTRPVDDEVGRVLAEGDRVLALGAAPDRAVDVVVPLGQRICEPGLDPDALARLERFATLERDRLGGEDQEAVGVDDLEPEDRLREPAHRLDHDLEQDLLALGEAARRALRRRGRRAPRRPSRRARRRRRPSSAAGVPRTPKLISR